MSEANDIYTVSGNSSFFEALEGKSAEEINEIISNYKSPAAESTANSAEEPVKTSPAENEAAYNARIEELIKTFTARQDQLLEEGLKNLDASKQSILPPTPLEDLGVPIEMDYATDIKAAQVVWLKARERGVENVGIQAVSDKLGKKAKDMLPLTLGNVALSAEMSSVVLAAYPDITAHVRELAAAQSGQDLMKNAGYEADTIKRMPQDVLDHWAMTQIHEKNFQTEGPSLQERLKSNKSTIFEALGNDKVRSSLKWAGLIVGCATGGIVVKAGVSGIQFLTSKLAENKAVQSMAQRLEDKAVTFVSKAFDIDKDKVQAKLDKGKEIAEKVGNSKWAKVGKAVAWIGVGVALMNVDFVYDAVSAVAGAGGGVAMGVLPAAAQDVLYQAGDIASAGFDSVNAGAAEIWHENILGESDAPVDPKDIADIGAEPTILPADLDVAPTVTDPVAGVATPAAPTAAPTVAPNAAIDPAVKVAPEATVPSEPTAASETVVAPEVPTVTTVEVKPGDNLWDIAESHLEINGIQASDQEIQALSDHIYQTNKDIIGSDPNKIFPGQQFVIDVPSPGSAPEIVQTEVHGNDAFNAAQDAANKFANESAAWAQNSPYSSKDAAGIAANLAAVDQNAPFNAAQDAANKFANESAAWRADHPDSHAAALAELDSKDSTQAMAIPPINLLNTDEVPSTNSPEAMERFMQEGTSKNYHSDGPTV